MSNERIADRLAMLADQGELGQIPVEEFAVGLLGQVDAIEGLVYAQVKEAHQVGAQLRLAIERGEAGFIDVHALGDWLRGWLSRVPGGTV